MFETIAPPRQLRLLYCDANGWNSIIFHKSSCDSYYSCYVTYDILCCKEIADLLAKYEILTVFEDSRRIILNRGNAVEKLKDLVADQEKVFDDYCLHNNNAKQSVCNEIESLDPDLQEKYHKLQDKYLQQEEYIQYLEDGSLYSDLQERYNGLQDKYFQLLKNNSNATKP